MGGDGAAQGEPPRGDPALHLATVEPDDVWCVRAADLADGQAAGSGEPGDRAEPAGEGAVPRAREDVGVAGLPLADQEVRLPVAAQVPGTGDDLVPAEPT